MNEKNSKIETVPITSQIRASIFTLLGLTPMDIDVIEICDRFVLSARNYRGMRVENRLEPLLAVEVPDFGAHAAGNSVVVNHVGGSLCRRSSHSPTTLWEELFPAPWKDFALLFQPEAGSLARAYPPTFESNLCRLWSGLQSLDELISHRELTCLVLRKQNYSLALLFHCIRGRRVHIHALSGLDVSEPENVRRALESSFGSPPGGIEVLTWDVSMPGEPLDRATRTLDQLLDEHHPRPPEHVEPIHSSEKPSSNYSL